MTQKEKADAYDSALEVLHRYDGANIMFTQDLKEEMFPELKESEDERIRKTLMSYLRRQKECASQKTFLGIPIEQIIAWFEKQGEKKPAEFDDTNAKRMFIKALERVEEQNNKGYKLTDCDKNSWWEDFKVYCGFSKIQKPADKVEPKFHEGDWIIHQGTENIYQVVAVIDNKYTLKYGDNYTIQNYADVDRCTRLWTIQDTKDGDVLKEDSCIFIIERMKSDGTATIHCCLFDDGDFDLGSTLSFDVDSTYPATKEQRDILMKAIADAGYTFDFEKKELKKIE